MRASLGTGWKVAEGGALVFIEYQLYAKPPLDVLHTLCYSDAPACTRKTKQNEMKNPGWKEMLSNSYKS